ncbi:hypothetical protein TREMEDRAFT_61785 [Tremella mesenterica DSM 1558]|uniref:uncharacterized protein n=1 Tax=Tremella mesenterica (strain ATCC 24925 / CBS 8224 / DSM 1558 / NBRC 9311 / NRRL Y-6157 / RJB 2259-6 / UBC 559-6) TaxID=578456 RepID=UPI0003F49103|nr:uncharacterized protein TREMEDRAFT_61785 [Tremella mesenterica DSM 1558]EIW70021.1 hypothetical protein TREMEDRAFT_61785 [Tremella mesenterica DSM 1558]
MLTYLQVHLCFIFPPIFFLFAILRPVLGRRDVIKIIFLTVIATVYTTPWDNWLIAQSGWAYPEGSVLLTIGYIPIEEHLFFILQPILLILLHTASTHPSLLPFNVQRLLASSSSANLHSDVDGETVSLSQSYKELSNGQKPKSRVKTSQQDMKGRDTIQTLPYRPFAAFVWGLVFLFGLALVNEAHDNLHLPLPQVFQMGRKVLYLGWILVWIAPVLSFVTFIGARNFDSPGDKWTFALGTGWLLMVDTIAIRSGSWTINTDTSIGVELWRGMPLEIIEHIKILNRVALSRPKIDIHMLSDLALAEQILKRGSKSFEVAKMAFGREMRIPLVAIYAWARVTDDLIDDLPPCDLTNGDLVQYKMKIIDRIRQHLHAAYDGSDCVDLEGIMDKIPHLTEEGKSAFRLFSKIVPRLIPIHPFLELCKGYETDLRFLSPPRTTITSSSPSTKSSTNSTINFQTMLRAKLENPNFSLEKYLPIKNISDLMQYADHVAGGSIAAAVCYLSWSVLTPPMDSNEGSEIDSSRPVDNFKWSERSPPRAKLNFISDEYESTNDKRNISEVKPNVKGDKRSKVLVKEVRDTSISEGCEKKDEQVEERKKILQAATEMGRALQLVNISRDVVKDALIGRIYVPLTYFTSKQSIVDLLLPSTRIQSYATYSLPLLDIAEKLRVGSEDAIGKMPRGARGGLRAMIASYFKISQGVRDKNGEVDERGVKVNQLSRVGAAAKAMWWG